MHKLMQKFFGFLKSSAQFIKVMSIFCVLCLILYWIKDMTGFNWTWLDFITPLLNIFINASVLINDNISSNFNINFDFKYIISTILLFSVFLIANCLQVIFNKLEELYYDGRMLIKKLNENAYNKSLESQNAQEQEQIKKYQIYIAAYSKKKISQLAPNIDLEKEIKDMNKFLIDKTGVSPTKYGEGFLYLFNDFNHIDSILPHYFKLIQSDVPLNYIICVQILPKELTNEFENMKKLINLNLFNQITTLSDTVWRYKYNKTHKYNTVQLGLYQKGNDTFEVQEFTEM